MAELTGRVPSAADGLLEGAVRYGQRCVAGVTPADLPRPTPCPAWDVEALLRHLTDSVGLLGQGITTGRLDDVAAWHGHQPPLAPDAADEVDEVDERHGTYGAAPRDPSDGSASSLVAAFHAGCERLLDAWRAGTAGWRPLRVGGLPLAPDTVAVVGAIEIAVHGWDVSVARGHPRPIAAELAADMLRLSRLVVGDADRSPMFAAPVDIPPHASPSDRLVAFLGRSPRP